MVYSLNILPYIGCTVQPTHLNKKDIMKYRLTIIFLASLLFCSFSFNCLHYDALIRAEYNSKFDSDCYGSIISKLHERLNEIEE